MKYQHGGRAEKTTKLLTVQILNFISLQLLQCFQCDGWLKVIFSLILPDSVEQNVNEECIALCRDISFGKKDLIVTSLHQVLQMKKKIVNVPFLHSLVWTDIQKHKAP